MAAELGFPVPQQPDLLEVLTEQSIRDAKDGKVLMDGVY